tara:strand:- start:1730 stop:2296 length:567 start_codon:yes stop_codon:yes gene_type:complete
MIGNDIIDLKLAKIQSNWQREGFLKKQFTNKEQEIILNADNSFFQVWLFWSMKEAAYKSVTQQSKKRFFSPQKFKCNLINENQGIVFFEGHKVHTTTLSNSFYIYTIASKYLKEGNVFSQIGSPKTVNIDIKNKLQEETGISNTQIKQRKSINGAPFYYHKEELLTNSCSISHHGKYGAFAFTLENEY